MKPAVFLIPIEYLSLLECYQIFDQKSAAIQMQKTRPERRNTKMIWFRYIFLKNLAYIDKPVNKTKWSMTPPTVNAYYTPTKNQVAMTSLSQIFFFCQYLQKTAIY